MLGWALVIALALALAVEWLAMLLLVAVGRGAWMLA
jgi:hypothetical protein